MDSNLVSRFFYYILLDIFICCFDLDDNLIIDEMFLLCGLNVCWNLDSSYSVFSVYAFMFMDVGCKQ